MPLCHAWEQITPFLPQQHHHFGPVVSSPEFASWTHHRYRIRRPRWEYNMQFCQSTPGGLTFQTHEYLQDVQLFCCLEAFTGKTSNKNPPNLLCRLLSGSFNTVALSISSQHVAEIVVQKRCHIGPFVRGFPHRVHT